ncbi:hypothetical protein [Methylobacterium tarhaniae]|uniref:hypothetical protein n=1 Tax=Methylobacterium tarhaniae TaxID=1187852 RepID=UPI000AA6B153|nr:hypothetical protein [Methylobacterium tarhaniae]
MAKFEITDREATYAVEAADRDAAVLAYAERAGLILGQDFSDANDLVAINDLFIEEV